MQLTVLLVCDINIIMLLMLLVLSTLFCMVVMVMSDRLMEPNSTLYFFSLFC
jgi:hypothetical protein